MNHHFRVAAAILIVLAALLSPASVTTQSPTDWNIGDVYVGIGRLSENPGKYLVYTPQGVLKEGLVDPTAATITAKGTPIGVTTGCAIAPAAYQDALYATTFYAMNVMQFASAHPHTASVAAAVTHPVADSIESVVFDNHGNYYVSGIPPTRERASDPIPTEAFIFKYRRVGAVDVLQATYTVPNGNRGVDWLDLGTDQQTFYYTSEGTKIHEYRPATTLGVAPVYREIQVRHASGQHAAGTIYAMRALPPIPGDPTLRPSGFLVALHSSILRVAYDGPENDGTSADRDGVIVSSYDVPGKAGQFFALNITPDGQAFWTATFQLDDAGLPPAGNLYKFHISSGALMKGPIAVEDAAGVRARSVWGLCVKREYTAAVNTCFDVDATGNVKRDANNNPITVVCRVPEICNQAGIDEDGDGKSDAEDEDCKNPVAPTIAVSDKTTAEGEVIDSTHAVNVSFPIMVNDPDGGPLTITSVTGLPSFLSWTQAGTGASAKVIFSGTIPFGSLTTDPTGAIGYVIRVRATDGVSAIEGAFRWYITPRNGPVQLVAPADRTCTAGLTCDTNFTVTVNEPDGDPASITATLPPGFQVNGLTQHGVLLSNGRQSYPLLVTGPVAPLPTTGSQTLSVCAVDVRGGKTPAYDPVCVSWTLHVVNQPPVIAPANQFTLFGQAGSYAVPVSDPDGHTVTVTSVTGLPDGMTATGNVISGLAVATGSFLVTVKAQDAFGGTATATFNWLVSTNRAPVADDDDATTLGASPLTINVLANDSDPDPNDSLSIVPGGFTQPANGSVALAPGVGFVYTANLGFSGLDQFSYTITDGIATATAVVRVTVTPARVCYAGANAPHVSATQDWWYNPDGTLTVRSTVSRNFNDNTYGQNAIGWPGNGHHRFSQLTRSDMLQLALFDRGGARSLEMKLDYLSESTGFSSGYGSLGVTGGDGEMVVGSSSHVVGADSSLARNFNVHGYVLTQDSPATDASYAQDPNYSNWIFDVWFEVTVRPEAFAAGFAYPRIVGMHASPSKTGVETEPMQPVVCSGASDGAPIAVADAYTVKRNATTRLAPSVLANDSDPEFTPLTAVLDTPPLVGSVALNSDGTFTYKSGRIPGVVTFTYRTKDELGNLSEPALVTITVR